MNTRVHTLFLGEVLFDLISSLKGMVDPDKITQWNSVPGGAPANSAVALARLGYTPGLLAAVGDDDLGRDMRSRLMQEGVDCGGLVSISGGQTGAAYIVTTATGDRQVVRFAGCINDGLMPTHLREEMFRGPHLLHFGSIPLAQQPTASATMLAIQWALANSMLVSFDPNYRPSLWANEDQFLQCATDTLPLSHIVKVSEPELHLLVPTKDGLDKKAQELREQFDIPLLLVTLAEQGALVVRRSGRIHVPAFLVELVEATGAGDAFIAAVLAGLIPHLENPANTGCQRLEILNRLSDTEIYDIVSTANAVGAYTCTQVGAWSSPTQAQLLAFMSGSH